MKQFILRRVTWKGPLYLWCDCSQCSAHGGNWVTDRAAAIPFDAEYAVTFLRSNRFFWDIRIDPA